MISGTNAFAPYIDGGGLTLGVGPGVALIGTTPTIIAGQQVTLTANTTNYVYLDLTAGTVSVNTSGFSTGVYPIATVVTLRNSVKTLTDSRADVGASGGGEISNGGSSVVVNSSGVTISDPFGNSITTGQLASTNTVIVDDGNGNGLEIGGGTNAINLTNSSQSGFFVDGSGNVKVNASTGKEINLEAAGGGQIVIGPTNAVTVNNTSGTTQGLAINGATPTTGISSGVVGLGATTAATASSGSATLPGNPVGFLEVNIGGTIFKLPYYAV